MNCCYCDRIAARDAGYDRLPAAFDLGSQAPRCPRHWRYLCGKCNRPAHFMATAYDPAVGRFYCSACATGRDEQPEPFWAWSYFFRYRSPFTEEWHPSLDRLEFEGLHPLQRYTGSGPHPSVSREPYLVRYPHKTVQWPLDHLPGNDEVKSSWNRNADRWLAGYDEDGDFTRRYFSDEAMLALLGDVRDKRVLDAGCGGGYLCRKLAHRGAIVTGIEQADRFFQTATGREAAEPLGITYHHGSITAMPAVIAPGDAGFDAVVSNYVLMDLFDYERAIAEIHRVLRPGGVFVAVISHPCFNCGPGGWVKPAPDSPRREERGPRMVDRYLDRAPVAAVWGNLDPVIGFHRPLRDYWHAFTVAGFRVTAFDESAPSDRARAELSPVRLADGYRIADACMFRLEK